MNKNLTLISLLFALSTPLAASAEGAEKIYIEYAASATKYTASNGWWMQPVVGLVRLGTPINESISIEGLIGTTVINAKDTRGNYVGKIDSMLGAYVKAQKLMADNFQIFGRIGGTYFSGNVYIPTSSTDALGNTTTSGYYAVASDSSLSYGVGVQYDLSANNYLTLDYMSYYSSKGATIAGPTAGFGMKF
jgi:hypothetical protein